MDNSFFRRSSRDSSPLLPQHNNHARNSSYPLSDLDPRPYTDGSASQSHSRSPIPSFHVPRSSSSPRSFGSPSRSRVHFSHPPVPPPIASVVLRPTASSQAQSKSYSASRTTGLQAMHNNPLAALTRREKALQAELQTLLDAQSAGLVEGRSYVDDGTSEAGSSTPTGRSRSRSASGSRNRMKDNGVVMPVRQPRKKKISLRGARRGILGTIEELGLLKEHEAGILQDEKRRLEEALRQLLRWEKKIAGFEEVIGKLNDGVQGREELDLKTEKSAVEMEITEIEARLRELRARDRVLGARIRELGNRREAEMSSFQEGKKGVQREVEEWLARPGVKDVTAMVLGLSDADGSDNSSHKDLTDDNDTIPFLALPAQRRTLPLASSWLSSSISALNSSLTSVSIEHDALLAGSELWSETLALVSGFEADLRKQMKEDTTTGMQLSVKDLENQLTKMEDVTGKLEQKEGVAQSEGWNLLICAIGAELEAFREGEGLLRGVLHTIDPKRKDVDEREYEDDSRDESFLTAPLSSEDSQQDQKTHGNDLDGLDQDADSVELEGLQDLSMSRRAGGIDHDDDGRLAGKGKSAEMHRDESPTRSESEDDGPPKALLVGLEEDRDRDEML